MSPTTLALEPPGVPVVLTSAGPAGELIALQDAFELTHPFICEGSADIHIPTGYFSSPEIPRPRGRTWEVIELGSCESQARAVRLLRSLYRSWDDMVILIGLGDDWADRFLMGEVDVPIIVRNDEVDQSGLVRMFPHAFVTLSSGPSGWSEAILGSMSSS